MYSTLEAYSNNFSELLKATMTPSKGTETNSESTQALLKTVANTKAFVGGVRGMLKGRSFQDVATRRLTVGADIIEQAITLFEANKTNFNKKEEIARLCKVLLMNVVRVISLDDILFINTFAVCLHQFDQEAKRMLSAKDPRSRGANFTAIVKTIREQIDRAKMKADDQAKSQRITTQGEELMKEIQTFLSLCLQGGTIETQMQSLETLGNNVIEFIELLRTLHQELFTQITEGREDDDLYLDRVKDVELLGATASTIYSDCYSATLTGFGDINEVVAIKTISATLLAAVKRSRSLLNLTLVTQKHGFKAQVILVNEVLSVLENEAQEVLTVPHVSDCLSRIDKVLNVQFPLLCSLLRTFPHHCVAEIQRIETWSTTTLVDILNKNGPKALESTKTTLRSMERLLKSTRTFLNAEISTVFTENVKIREEEAKKVSADTLQVVTNAIGGNNVNLAAEKLKTLEHCSLLLCEALNTPKTNALFSAYGLYFLASVPFKTLPALTPNDQNVILLAQDLGAQYKALDQFMQRCDPTLIPILKNISPFGVIKAIKEGNVNELRREAEVLQEKILEQTNKIFEPESSKGVLVRAALMSVDELHSEVYRTDNPSRSLSQMKQCCSALALNVSARITLARTNDSDGSGENFAISLEKDLLSLYREMKQLSARIEQSQSKKETIIAPHPFVPLLVSLRNICEGMNASYVPQTTLLPSQLPVIATAMDTYRAALTCSADKKDKTFIALLIAELGKFSEVCLTLGNLQFPHSNAEIAQNNLLKTISKSSAMIASELEKGAKLTKRMINLIKEFCFGLPQQTAWVYRLINEIKVAEKEWPEKMSTKTIHNSLGQLVTFMKSRAEELEDDILESNASKVAECATQLEAVLSDGTELIAQLIDEDGEFPFDLEGALQSNDIKEQQELISLAAQDTQNAINSLMNYSTSYAHSVAALKTTKKFEQPKRRTTAKAKGLELVTGFINAISKLPASVSQKEKNVNKIISELSNSESKSLTKRLSCVDIENGFLISLLDIADHLIVLRKKAKTSMNCSADVQLHATRVLFAFCQLSSLSIVYRNNKNTKSDKSVVKQSITNLEKLSKFLEECLIGSPSTPHNKIDVVANGMLAEVAKIVDWEEMLLNSAGRLERSCTQHTLNTKQVITEEAAVEVEDLVVLLQIISKECKFMNRTAQIHCNFLSERGQGEAETMQSEVSTRLTLCSEGVVHGSKDTDQIIEDITHNTAETLAICCGKTIPRLLDNAKVCEANICKIPWKSKKIINVVSYQLALARSRLYLPTSIKKVKRMLISSLSSSVQLCIDLCCEDIPSPLPTTPTTIQTRLSYLCYLLASDGSMPFTSDMSFNLDHLQYMLKLKATVAELVEGMNTATTIEERQQLQNLARAERSMLIQRMTLMEGNDRLQAQILLDQLNAIIEDAEIGTATKKRTLAEFVRSVNSSVIDDKRVGDRRPFYTPGEFVIALADTVQLSKELQQECRDSGIRGLESKGDELDKATRVVVSYCKTQPEKFKEIVPVVERLRKDLGNSIEENASSSSASASVDVPLKCAHGIRLSSHRILRTLYPDTKRATIVHAAGSLQALQNASRVAQDPKATPEVSQRVITDQGVAVQKLGLFLDNIVLTLPVDEQKNSEDRLATLSQSNKSCNRICLEVAAVPQPSVTQIETVDNTCGQLKAQIIRTTDSILPFIPRLIELAVACSELSEQVDPNLPLALQGAGLCRDALNIAEIVSESSTDQQQKKRIKDQKGSVADAEKRLATDFETKTTSNRIHSDLVSASESLNVLLGAVLGENAGKYLLEVLQQEGPQQAILVKVLLNALQATNIDPEKISKIKKVRADVNEEGVTDENVQRVTRIITGSKKPQQAKALQDNTDHIYTVLHELHRTIDVLRNISAKQKKGVRGPPPSGPPKDFVQVAQHLSEVYIEWSGLILGYAEKYGTKSVPPVDVNTIDHCIHNGHDAVTKVVNGVKHDRSKVALAALEVAMFADANALRLLEPETKARETLFELLDLCGSVLRHPRKAAKNVQKVTAILKVFTAALEVTTSVPTDTLRSRRPIDTSNRSKRLNRISHLPLNITTSEDKQEEKKLRRIHSTIFLSVLQTVLCRYGLATPISSSAAIAYGIHQANKGSEGDSSPLQTIAFMDTIRLASKSFEKANKSMFLIKEKQGVKETMKKHRKGIKTNPVKTRYHGKDIDTEEVEELLNNNDFINLLKEGETLFHLTLEHEIFDDRMFAGVVSEAKIDLAELKVNVPVVQSGKQANINVYGYLRKLEREANDSNGLGRILCGKISNKNIRREVVLSLCEKVEVSMDEVDNYLREIGENLVLSNEVCLSFISTTDELIIELLRSVPASTAILVNLNTVQAFTAALAEAKQNNCSPEELEIRKQQLEQSIQELKETVEKHKASGKCTSQDGERLDKIIIDIEKAPKDIIRAKSKEDLDKVVEKTRSDVDKISQEILADDIQELYLNNEKLQALLVSGEPLNEQTAILLDRQSQLVRQLAGTGHDGAREVAIKLIKNVGDKMHEKGMMDEEELIALPKVEAILEYQETDTSQNQNNALNEQTLLVLQNLSVDDLADPDKAKQVELGLRLLGKVAAEKAKRKGNDPRLLRSAMLLADMYKQLLGSNEQDLLVLQDIIAAATFFTLDEIKPLKTMKDIMIYAKEAIDYLKKNDMKKATAKANKVAELVDIALKSTTQHSLTGHPLDQVEAGLYKKTLAPLNVTLHAEISKAEQGKPNQKELEQIINKIAFAASERSSVPPIAAAFVALENMNNYINGEIPLAVAEAKAEDKEKIEEQLIAEFVDELYYSLDRVREVNGSHHPVEKLRKAAIQRSKRDCEALIKQRKALIKAGKDHKEIDQQIKFVVGTGVVASHSVKAVHCGIEAQTLAAKDATEMGQKNIALKNALSMAALCDAEALFVDYTDKTKLTKQQLQQNQPNQFSIEISKNGHNMFTAVREDKGKETQQQANSLHAKSVQADIRSEPQIRESDRADTIIKAAELIELLQKKDKTSDDDKVISVLLPKVTSCGRSLAKKLTNPEEAKKLAALVESLENSSSSMLNVVTVAKMCKTCEQIVSVSAGEDKTSSVAVIASLGSNCTNELKEIAKESGANTTTSLAMQERANEAKLGASASARAIIIIGKDIKAEKEQEVSTANSEGKAKRAAAEQEKLDSMSNAFISLDKQQMEFSASSETDGKAINKSATTLQATIDQALASCHPEEAFLNTNEEIDKTMARLQETNKAASAKTRSDPNSNETQIARWEAEEATADALSLLAAHRGILAAIAEDEDDKNEKVALKAAADLIGKNIEPLVTASASSIYDGDDKDLADAIARILAPSKKAQNDVSARRKRLTPAGMEGDEILEAAFSIEDHLDAQDFDSEKTEVQLDALDLSGLMQQLAIVAKANDRPKVLEIGKLIKLKVNQIAKHANSVVVLSNHPQTIKMMQSTCSTATDHGIQLSILCSVKAASDTEDPTMKSNLIKCAKEIAKAVVEMMKLEKVSQLIKTRAK